MYKGFREEKVCSLSVLNKAHEKLEPKCQVLVDEAATRVQEMILAITPDAKIGRGYSLEIVAAIGRELRKHAK